MPPKIRKKSETGGLDQPDQVMTKLQTTYGFLDKYKYYIVGGFVGAVVLLLGISGVLTWQQTREKDLAKSFFDAFKHFEAPITETGAAVEGVKSFKTEEAKFTALSEELGAFVAENSSADIATTARLALASAKMELGEYEVAYDLLKEFEDGAGKSGLVPFVYENLGYASLRLGKSEEAISYFEKMKGATSNTYVVVRALMHLGDLYNPGARSAAVDKDAGKATEYYKEALGLLPEEEAEGEIPDPAITLTRQEIELRLSMLDLG